MKTDYNEIVDILVANGIDISSVKITMLRQEGEYLDENKFVGKIEKYIDYRGLHYFGGNIEIYTDGSCTINDGQHSGTFGLVVIIGGLKAFEYSERFNIATNNRMEMMAVIIASQIAKYIHTRWNLLVDIFSDSKYTLNTFTEVHVGPKNKDLQDMFNNLKINTNAISFRWVKAHSGNEYNEYVDNLCSMSY
jgi:ribonuclease HI